MHRLTSALAGAALSLAMAAIAVPVQAASPQAAPAVLTGDQATAGVQLVHDTRWRHRHRHRDHDDFRFGFSFGGPFVHSYPTYAYRRAVCPYGYAWNGYGCVVTYPHYRTYRHVEPGFSVRFGF